MSSSNLPDPTFNQAFDSLIELYIEQSNDNNKGLISYFDKEWLSPCYQSIEAQDNDIVQWKPFLRTDEASLSNLEDALGVKIPSALHHLFCRYYSLDINAQAEYGKLTILQAWNSDDFDRLQKNLIAHVLMKRRLKQADTLFFALTDDDDYILSVLLSNGAVMLEKVGKEPTRVIAPDLLTFMTGLTPLPELVSL